MSTALLGVIVGGFIASVVPLVTLLLSHTRWKREAKLEYLRSERTRLEQLFDKTLAGVLDGMKEHLYSSDITSDILVLLPKDVSDRFFEFMEDNDKSAIKCKHAYMDLAVAMKKVLANIDAQIRDLVS